MFDYSKLHGRIVEKYGSQSAFADACGVSRQSVPGVIKHGKMMRESTVMRWAELLDITGKDMQEYFFTLKVW